MNEQWKSRFLKVMSRNSEEEANEFVRLVDEVDNQCTLDIAKILLKSFSTKPDYGTQEGVISVLAGCDKTDAITSILEELPRLMREAPEWAKILVGQEVDRRPALLMEVANRSSHASIEALRELLSNEDFRDVFPRARNLKI